LGANVRLAPENVAACIETVGIGFLFAPLVHSAMRHAQPIRAELKMRTIFNLLGPLTNPAGAAAQVVGVFDDKLVVPIAQVLCRLGARRAFVVHGSDGLDEITLTGPTHIAEVVAGEVLEQTVGPRDFGLAPIAAGDLVAGDREANAEIMRTVLEGQPGPKRDVVVVNAAAALVAAGKAQNFQEGASQAAESLAAGKAREKFDEFVRFTNRFPAA
jgi:anthranilate phosphoribosyltransferase